MPTNTVNVDKKQVPRPEPPIEIRDFIRYAKGGLLGFSVAIINGKLGVLTSYFQTSRGVFCKFPEKKIGDAPWRSEIWLVDKQRERQILSRIAKATTEYIAAHPPKTAAANTTQQDVEIPI